MYFTKPRLIAVYPSGARNLAGLGSLGGLGDDYAAASDAATLPAAVPEPVSAPSPSIDIPKLVEYIGQTAKTIVPAVLQYRTAERQAQAVQAAAAAGAPVASSQPARYSYRGPSLGVPGGVGSSPMLLYALGGAALLVVGALALRR